MVVDTVSYPAPGARRSHLIIVGTGFGGIATAVKAKKSGIHDFLVLERAGDVGGVWRDNRYPGCACDVQSHLYSFSFAPNPDWTRDFSPQGEIHAYLQRCARDFDLHPHLRLNTDVLSMRWDESAAEWVLQTSQGEYSARHVVLGMGSLSDPLIPAIPEREHFEGTAFHSARWPEDLDLRGKRVAVVGTGASAIQFIPAIQPLVAHLTVFQRTPPWVMPRHDGPISPERRSRMKRHPWLQRLLRMQIYASREMAVVGFRNPLVMRMAQRKALRHLHAAVRDSELRAKLTPDYTLGCKRILISNNYYPAMAQSNVEVVTTGIERATARGLVDRHGVERKFDVIIWGAGFQVKELPWAQTIVGRTGQTLSQAWAGSPKSLAGTTVHGFPNLFLLHGPNVGLGHSSVIYMLEAQADHALDAITHADLQRHSIVEPRLVAQERYTAWVDRKMQGTVWSSGGCDSWYLDRTGRNSSLWPSYTFAYRQRVATVRLTEYDFRSSMALVGHS